MILVLGLKQGSQTPKGCIGIAIMVCVARDNVEASSIDIDLQRRLQQAHTDTHTHRHNHHSTKMSFGITHHGFCKGSVTYPRNAKRTYLIMPEAN
jgi:hypothetical protein